jgi:hypothetical protein
VNLSQATGPEFDSRVEKIDKTSDSLQDRKLDLTGMLATYKKNVLVYESAYYTSSRSIT